MLRVPTLGYITVSLTNEPVKTVLNDLAASRTTALQLDGIQSVLVSGEMQVAISSSADTMKNYAFTKSI